MNERLQHTRNSHASLPRRTRARRDGDGVAARVLLLLFALSLLCASALSVAARQERPKIADEVEGEGKTKSKSGSKSSGGSRESDAAAPRSNSRTTSRRSARAAPRPAPAPLLPVTIHTGAADVSIYLNAASAMQLLGKTGGDGSLSTRLARGVHSVTASRPGSRIVRQQIDVRPGSTSFSIDLSGRGAADGARVGATSAADVFARFLDPKRTDSVTLADWQLAREQTAATYTQNSLDPLNIAQALFAEGQVAHLRGDHASALVAFNNAALTTPGSALAYYGLGNAYLATNQLSEAGRAYQQAIRNNTSMAIAYKGMGDVLARQGKDKDALDYYARARSQGYDSPSLDAARGRTLLRLRRWQQALDTLLPLSRKAPSTDVLLGVGDAYVGLKQPMSAAGAYRQAAQQDPKSALAHYKYGELSHQMREWATAVEALERALALDPAGTSINRSRAREMADAAARRLGRKD
ncbi:MAG TPA: tetratricopeptide repeat protein [Pyrinomonadaceae bacterium]|nr:tetratricopeptide repeat protein [Pyrinomonadaceae bacterium]